MNKVDPNPLNKKLLQRLKPEFANFGSHHPDKVLKGGTIVDTYNGKLVKADVLIKNDLILGISENGFSDQETENAEVIDISGKFVSPGFINTHLHVESSLITPQEYSRMIVPRGTTTIICDPHEAANVKGTLAFDFFLDSAQESVLDIFIGLSTCVPAMELGSSGAELYAADLEAYVDRAGVVGAAEYMDIGGMMTNAPKTLDIMNLFKGWYIGGHMPNITDREMLRVIRNFGVQDDHECTSADEARIKLEEGFNIMIREGTAAKNLEALLPIINQDNDERIMFCTDDRHPDEVQDFGELDYIIRQSIAAYNPEIHGADKENYVVRVYQAATYWAAQNFGFSDRGVIESGMKADLVILDSLEDCRASMVIKDGMVADDALFSKQEKVNPNDYGLYDTIQLKYGAHKISSDDLKVFAEDASKEKTTCAIMGLQAGQIVTQYEEHELNVSEDGEIMPDAARDIAKISVIERHGKNGNIGTGFVRGFNMKNGAIASSVGHDDHNIIVMGSDNEQMAAAVNALKEEGGGFVIVKDNEVKAIQPLPVCGLMSDRPWEEVADIQREFLKAAGSKELPDPTMALAFLALGVIPDIKLRVPTNEHPQSLTRFAPWEDIEIPQTWELEQKS